MDEVVGAIADCGQGVCVRDVNFVHAEALVRPQMRNVGRRAGQVIVDDAQRMAVAQQALADVRADEAGAAGDDADSRCKRHEMSLQKRSNQARVRSRQSTR